jgi:hypothetical protein
MTMYVLVEHQPEGTVVASLIGWPAMLARGRSEEEALAHLRRSFTTRLHRAKLVPLEVDLPPPANLWLDLAGSFTDDPLFEAVQRAIAADRRELDAPADPA